MSFFSYNIIVGSDFMEKDYLFKKIYVEITNLCNLNCDFCLKSKRKKHSLSIDEFKYILNEIKPFTNYIYMHVLGEPLLHPSINSFIDYASRDFNVNITTNGYLINNLNTNNIRQINISLHSFNKNNNKSLDTYMNDIFNFEEKYSDNTYINYRLWVNSNDYNSIIKSLEDHYHVLIDKEKNNFKLKDNVYLNIDKKFNWPQDSIFDGKLYTGTCYALKDHVAILSDGTVTACCLDGNGVLSFDNIFKKHFKDIITSEKFNDFKSKLSSGVRPHELCKHCNFLKRD